MEKNYELLQKAFGILHPMLSAYICQEMERVYKDDWWSQVLEALSDQYDLPATGDYAKLQDSLDIANCLRLIDRRWRDVFSQKWSKSYRNWASELMGVHDKVPHIDDEDFSQSYTERALDTMALLCEPIDGEATAEIRAIYRKIRYGSEEGSTAVKANAQPVKPQKAAAEVLKKNVGENLPSWRDIMEPHPDVAEGRYQAAEFAADLSQVSKGEGAYEYRDPVEFFNRTYVTEGMSSLLVEALKRVTNHGGEPVIQLKTAFGGGKTHSMLALYHLMHSKVSADDLPNIKPVLEKAGLTELPYANVAVLVGTSMDPAKRKNPTDFPGYTVSTIWGEMAYQLCKEAGKPELYPQYIRDADRKGVSPGSDNLAAFLNACGPCLVLMDELVAYAKKLYGVDGLPAGSYDNFITFIQEITEAARRSENSLVVASIPESAIEIGGEAGQKALEAIEHTFGRMEAIWKPVAANEGFEVVRRRLFLDCKDPEARNRVCEAFSQLYLQNSTDFPSAVKEVDYKKRLISCYPIHPEVFDRLYGDWSTLERFQRTRGVLRLMAAVIHELWMANDESAMIMPGSLPLDTPAVRDELLRYLPDTWNSILDKEVDGKDSIPYQKDRENIRYGQSMACRRVARSIMLGTAPSTAALRNQGIRGMEVNQIMLGTVQPGENIANFRDALNTLHGSLTYLYNSPNGNRYWFDTKPTLRKTAEDRASQLSAVEVNVEIESRLKKIRKEAPFGGVHICPASSNDVPDEKVARLVILRPTDVYEKNRKTTPAMESIQDIFSNRGTSPRIYRNMLAFVAPDRNKLGALEQEVKRFLAWTSILSDKQILNLDLNQVQEAETSLKRSNTTVDARLKETYCWLIVPYIDPIIDMKDIQWEPYDLGGGTDSIVKKAANEMQKNELIISKWAPTLLQMTLDDYLWKNSDHLSVSQLWEYLAQYCYLPRLSDYNVLETAIREGATSEEFFAIAANYDEENKRYKDLKLGDGVFSVHNSDLLVKVDVAKKQLEADRKKAEEAQNQTGSQDGNSGTAIPANPTTTYTPNGDDGDNPHVHENQPQNKHFYMSVDLDNTRVNRDVDQYVREIIRHLQNVDDAQVTLKLEVEVEAPNGIPDGTVRTVSENCNTLKVKDYGFDG